MNPSLASLRLAALALPLLAAEACGPRPEEAAVRADPAFVRVEVTTVGVGLESGVPVVLLQQPGFDRQMPIWVGPNEAAAIQRALRGEPVPRPMTHDLLAAIALQAGARVVDVRVHHAEGGVYFGMLRLRVRGESGIREVDSRPSDAVALALRLGAPILVRRELFDSAPQVNFLAPEASEQVVQTAGLTVVAPTPDMRTMYRLPDQPGVLVLRAEGAAATAGFRPGDLIVSVDTTPITTPMELLRALRPADRPATAAVRYWRDGSVREGSLPRPERTRKGGVPAQVSAAATRPADARG